MSSSTTFAAPTLAQLWGDKTDVTVSLGAKTAPRYLGSKDQTVSLLPNISAKRGIFYANALRGVGAQYLNDSGLYTSAGVPKKMTAFCVMVQTVYLAWAKLNPAQP